VVDRHVEAAVGLGIEKSVETELLHSAALCVARCVQLGDAFFTRPTVTRQPVATTVRVCLAQFLPKPASETVLLTFASPRGEASGLIRP
jgi:hypothetical protein